MKSLRSRLRRKSVNKLLGGKRSKLTCKSERIRRKVNGTTKRTMTLQKGSTSLLPGTGKMENGN